MCVNIAELSSLPELSAHLGTSLHLAHADGCQLVVKGHGVILGILQAFGVITLALPADMEDFSSPWSPECGLSAHSLLCKTGQTTLPDSVDKGRTQLRCDPSEKDAHLPQEGVLSVPPQLGGIQLSQSLQGVAGARHEHFLHVNQHSQLSAEDYRPLQPKTTAGQLRGPQLGWLVLLPGAWC